MDLSKRTSQARFAAYVEGLVEVIGHADRAKPLNDYCVGLLIAEDLRYGLNHWDCLTRFLDDGRIELDTNIVERGIRPIVLNRKNALFAGHDEGAANWACIASLIECCKLNNVDPQAYFADVLMKLVNLWPASRIDDLMPWAWGSAHRIAEPQKTAA